MPYGNTTGGHYSLKAMEQALLLARRKQRGMVTVITTMQRNAGPGLSGPPAFLFHLWPSKDGDLPYLLLSPGPINPWLNSVDIHSIGPVLSRETISTSVKSTAKFRHIPTSDGGIQPLLLVFAPFGAALPERPNSNRLPRSSVPEPGTDLCPVPDRSRSRDACPGRV